MEIKKEYILTDGSDVYHPHEIKLMTQSEYEEEQRKCEEYTDGIWGWILYDPVTMGSFIQPQV